MEVRRHGAAIAGSAAAVAVATALVYALRPLAPTLSLGVLYTLAVLATSVVFGLGYALIAALGSMLAFNFLFLPPVHTLTLADGRNWAALAVYLATAVVSSELAARARRRAAEAEQREREAGLLSDAAAALLQEAPLDEIRLRADRVLAGADAAARHRFEAAVDALLALAEERNDAEAVRRSDAIKTVILQTVSHDFRTPLATIQAAAGSLEHGSLDLSPADRGALLETIRLETTRLSRLVENVLDLSRLQAGAAAPNPALWAVDDLVTEALGELSSTARVLVTLPPALPAARVDAVQIQRVLVNLIENALKFSEDDIEVRALEAGGAVAIEVLDRGRGIDAVGSSHRGLGLGLAIAHGFTTANGGTLAVGARAGGGTVARLLLPAEPIPAGVAG
jgi:two-component system, OmpR family, sensor histidine kinase KdpD